MFMFRRANILRIISANVNYNETELNFQPQFSHASVNGHFQKPSNNFRRLSTRSVFKALSTDSGLKINITNRRYASTVSNWNDLMPQMLAKINAQWVEKCSYPLIFEELAKQYIYAHMPVEMLQNCLTFMHATLGLPWWSTIAIGTLTARIILMPLVIFAERHSAEMSNDLRQMQFLQTQLIEAGKGKNRTKTAQLMQEVSLFKKHQKFSFFYASLASLAQAPFFVLFLTALRGMTNSPMQSLQESGLLWCNDFTVADPTFTLPILTSATLYAIIELTIRDAKFLNTNRSIVHMLRISPLLLLPFTINSLAVINFYWTCNNLITIVQNLLLQNHAIRNYFQIEIITPIASNAFASSRITSPSTSRVFLSDMSTKISNYKMRQRVDTMRFSKVRKEQPIVKCLPTDPIETKRIREYLRLRTIMGASKIKF